VTPAGSSPSSAATRAWNCRRQNRSRDESAYVGVGVPGPARKEGGGRGAEEEEEEEEEDAEEDAEDAEDAPLALALASSDAAADARSRRPGRAPSRRRASVGTARAEIPRAGRGDDDPRVARRPAASAGGARAPDIAPRTPRRTERRPRGSDPRSEDRRSGERPRRRVDVFAWNARPRHHPAGTISIAMTMTARHDES
jgi:hypothetical protein